MQQAQRQSQGQSNLENISSYSFPGNHLLQISLVRQPLEEGSYKRAHFFFVTLAPGEQTQTGRTFNFQNRINMKVEGHKMAAFAAALKIAAAGQDQQYGKFTIYVDSSKSQFGSGGGGKSMMLQSGTNQKTNERSVALFFKAGQGPAVTYVMTPYDAIGMAEIIEGLVKVFKDLEFSKTVQGTYSNPSFVNNPTQNSVQNPPMGNFPPSEVSPFQSNPNQVAGNFANNLDDFGDAPF